MESSESGYVVGIDLGTTNSAVSYVRPEAADGGGSRIELFHIPQVVDTGMVAARPVLPSFLYLSGGYELPEGALDVPWRKESRFAVGVFARDQGSRVPGRLVASAKSWLCHGRVDRKAPILPWGADLTEVEKVSPVDASARYLEHMRDAWNFVMAGGSEELRLEYQDVVLTVPASFDEVARELTLESARKAGLQRITLIEEPLAAFYAWLREHEQDWGDVIRPGQAVLICDIGGGTTDFTLVTLRESEGGPRFERLAVSDHLMLGGDNMDLALARFVEHRLTGKVGGLDTARWQVLCHQCRQAKEAILDGREEQVKVSVSGTGTRFIAGTLTDVLDREGVEHLLIDGFFPLSTKGELPERQRTGLTEFGLPYAQEPAVTRHLWNFISRHGDELSRVLGRSGVYPDWILFNGGVFRSSLIRDRVAETVRSWFIRDAPEGWDLKVLSNPSPDLAVALGAAYYGLVRRGRGVRVGSGSPRSYFLGLEASDGRDPGAAGEVAALCVVERGQQEGVEHVIDRYSFEVRANQPVGFDVYSSSTRSGDRTGDLVTVSPEEMTPLPQMRTVIQFGKKAGETAVPVQIQARYTEIGTLELGCRTPSGSHSWRLQFHLRGDPRGEAVITGDTLDEGLIGEAVDLVCRAFRKEDAGRKAPEHLFRELERLLDRSKERIPGTVLRRLADGALRMESGRSLSPSHEARWLNLLGFCVRPGFGDPLDEWRIKNIWKCYGPGLRFPRDAQCRVEWWVFWRRVAGGLSSGQQRHLFQSLGPILRGAGRKGPQKMRPNAQEMVEIWRAAANLERLPVDAKVEMGRLLLGDLSPRKSKAHEWWVLSRLGSRIPLYGPLDRVAPRGEVEHWVKEILAANWKQTEPVIRALSQMARRVGDRERDLSEKVLERVRSWMKEMGASEKHLRPVVDVVVPSEGEDAESFGESLPAGIRLRTWVE